MAAGDGLTPIARGRAADVFAAGPGRVLRRYRPGEPHDAAYEARAMEHAAAHGFPVPRVHEAGGTDLVMDRLDGPTMLADLTRAPWRLVTHARTLARLHDALHAVPALDGLRCPFGRGEVLVHLDLHPDNVILSPRGPVVIDWSNAARGDAADDVALTWVIMRTSVVPGPLPFRVLARACRAAFLDAFLSRVDCPEDARSRVPEIARERLGSDRHLLELERRALTALAGDLPPQR